VAEESQDQACLNCGAVMFPAARIDDAGHMAVNTLTQVELQHVGGKLYFKCTKCNAKNYVEMSSSPDGVPQLRFVRTTP
jgi:hypothetical protein